MEITHQDECVEIKFTGRAQGQIFDSNIEEDLKTLNPEAKPQKTLVFIGSRMVVNGLDSALAGKEIGKEYSVSLEAKDAFGNRRPNLVKTIPLKVFTEQKIAPYPGMALILDSMIAKVLAVSGSRVITDFNNPLSGKEISYAFTIIRKITDEKEKAEAFFSYFFKVVPKFEINEKIIVEGPKPFEHLVHAFAEKFKKLVGKELVFTLKETEEKSPEQPQQSL